MNFFQNVFSVWKSLRTSRRTALARKSRRLAPLEPLEVRTLLAAAFTEFVDPHPASGNGFGGTVVTLSTGNVVVTSPDDDAGGNNAGAVYLFNGSTGALISTITGSTAGDRIGSAGVTALANGNFVIESSQWQNGALGNAGAVTWGSGITGVTGVVSPANSLVGSTANDSVGSSDVLALSNGNYVVRSGSWDNGAVAQAGAVTWGNGTTGISGVITAANSLVGSTAGDQVGGNALVALSNGNYVVRTQFWNNGAVNGVGAVTWGSGTTGVVGTISAANSLIGSTAGDQVGSNLTALSNGNYVVRSTTWDNGAVADAGAVTWGSGTAGVQGNVSAANSLVGSSANDQVGNGGVTELTNGNYVVRSADWDNGAAVAAGAVTWGSGTSGVVGAVSAANSLVGTTNSNQVGSTGVTPLSNGNYVVASGAWDNGAVANVGAVTWGNGTTGVKGAVSAANSLIGSVQNDAVGSGGATALTNGNYVVVSSSWDNGAVTSAGAVTWANGTTGLIGTVTTGNSLVGSSGSDLVGNGGVTALTNGNYVVRSNNWDNGAAINAAAVTWGNGTTGIVGAVTPANSLVGTTTNDSIGNVSVIPLTNGNYVVASSNWDNGAVVNAGAATWGNGTSGIVGAITAANSLVGTQTSDVVSSNGITALTNGNYLVGSGSWDNGAIVDAGAATWGNGATGTTGAVSTANSLFGTTAGDGIGGGITTALTNGNYVVRTSSWNNGAVVDAGAVTWGNGTTGIVGAVSAANSLVGSTANDSVGNGAVTALSNGNYLVTSLSWDNGALAGAGALTWGSGTAGVTGVVSASNSAIGSTANAGLSSTMVIDDNNRTFFGRFTAEVGGRVRVGSTLSGFSGNADPILGGTIASQNVNDNATLAPFSTLIVNDPNNQNMFARVTILNGVVRGDFTAGSAVGWTRTVVGNDIKYERFFNPQANIGSVVQTAIRAFVFQPRSNAIIPNTTELTDFTVFVNDGVTNFTKSGIRVVTTSVNNAPSIGGANPNVAVNDNATVNPFSTLTVTDADNQEMLAKITILNGVVRGDFTNAVSAGWTRSVLGNNINYVRYFSPGLNVGATVQAAYRALIFQPRNNVITPGTTELTDFLVIVSDGVAAPVSNQGTRVTTSSVNDVPTIGGAVANQTMNDNQTKAVFSTLTVTDADLQNILARVTIVNGVIRGDFTVASTPGWSRTVLGNDIKYERFFNPQANIGATVQTAIRALVFQPRTNVPIGTSETTGFTVFLNDGASNTTNSTTSVITTGVAPRMFPVAQAAPPQILEQDITTLVLPSVRNPAGNPLTRILKKSR